MSALPPKGRIEWNLNTLIQLVSLVGMLFGGAAIWINNDRDITDLQDWRKEHEQSIKDRLAERKANDARFDQRLVGLETDLRKQSSIADNLTYRVTTVETQASTMSQTVNEIQKSLSQQSGDLRVIKEILQRLEASSQKRER